MVLQSAKKQKIKKGPLIKEFPCIICRGGRCRGHVSVYEGSKDARTGPHTIYVKLPRVNNSRVSKKNKKSRVELNRDPVKAHIHEKKLPKITLLESLNKSLGYQEEK